jgi:hypothetical protein
LARIKPGVHAVSVELDLVKPTRPSGACLTRAASCGFTQVGGDMFSLPRRMERIVEAIGF